MLARVRDERGRDGEGHAAQVALVRLLARVPPLVVGQRAGLSEGLAADVAHVRLFAAVQPAGGSSRVTFLNNLYRGFFGGCFLQRTG